MKRTIAVVATSVAMTIGLAVSASAINPTVVNGASMTRPTSTAKYGSISGYGCGVTTTAKVDRAQSILTDPTADSSHLCYDVGVRHFYVSGTSSYYSAWAYDADAAVIINSSYNTASYVLRVIYS